MGEKRLTRFTKTIDFMKTENCAIFRDIPHSRSFMSAPLKLRPYGDIQMRLLLLLLLCRDP